MKRRLPIGSTVLLMLVSSLAFGQRLVADDPNFIFKNPYTELYFASSQLGYVWNGDLFRTTNGGSTWLPLIGPASNRRMRVSEIFFVDASTFFVFGNEFLRTTDGGTTFTTISMHAPLLRERNGVDEVRGGFFFLDADHGWTLGHGQTLVTVDGGLAWKPFDVDTGQTRIWMFDAQQGIATDGAHGVSRTRDGGKTWEAVPRSPVMRRVRCITAGFCVGANFPDSVVYLSRDRGDTWQATQTGLLDDDRDDVHDFRVITAESAVIVGSHNDIGYSAATRHEAGETIVSGRPPWRAFLLRWIGTGWQRYEYPELEGLNTIQYVTETDAWASSGNNALVHSTDGAQTWTFVPDYYRQIAALTPSPPPLVLPTLLPAPTPTP